jgi:hypothetical protein
MDREGIRDPSNFFSLFSMGPYYACINRLTFILQIDEVSVLGFVRYQMYQFLSFLMSGAREI